MNSNLQPLTWLQRIWKMPWPFRVIYLRHLFELILLCVAAIGIFCVLSGEMIFSFFAFWIIFKLVFYFYVHHAIYHRMKPAWCVVLIMDGLAGVALGISWFVIISNYISQAFRSGFILNLEEIIFLTIYFLITIYLIQDLLLAYFARRYPFFELSCHMCLKEIIFEGEGRRTRECADCRYVWQEKAGMELLDDEMMKNSETDNLPVK